MLSDDGCFPEIEIPMPPHLVFSDDVGKGLIKRSVLVNHSFKLSQSS